MNALVRLVSLLEVLSTAVSAEAACGDPPPIQFAALQGERTGDNAVGEVVSYACDLGYVASGAQQTAQCILTDGGEAAWTELDLACKPRSCGDPGYVVHGEVVGALFTFPNAVAFECEEGFRLRGNARRYCQASGAWSGAPPRCTRIFCAPPPSPENGQVIYDSLEYGSEAKYECQKGYHVEGEDIIAFCTSNGTWSTTDLKCVEVACPIPQKPQHGSVELLGSHLQAGTLAVFSCGGDRIAGGPTTSKCLDTGQWTFPTPECLEPCAVPFVQNGKIGRYVRGRGYTSVFREIGVGSRLEDEEKLFLHCSSGYSPLGSTSNWQERVTCKRGRWTVQPFCEPRSCQSEPPATRNGRVKEVQRRHGGSVLYECLPDFRRTETGDVICLFGEWKGVTPFCRDTRCSSDELAFPGLEKGPKRTYKDGETMAVECDSRHALAKGPDSYLQCDEGFWKGPMPPCVPASCLGPPPVIEHGRALVLSSNHSSAAQYVCDQHHSLVRSGEVRCLFGQWSGQTPVCRDSRCYLRGLPNREGVSLDVEVTTNSGDRLGVQCAEGYEPQDRQPMCHNGVWSQYEGSPCREKECPVPRVGNGEVMRHTLGPREWRYWEFRYARPSIFTKLSAGSVPSRRDSVYLVCGVGFSVHGTGGGRTPITCSRGRWSPDPVCLPTGRTTTKKPLLTTNGLPSTTSSPVPTTAPELPPTANPDTLVEEEPTTPKATPSSGIRLPPVEKDASGLRTADEDCTCEYTWADEKVVAYTDEGRELRELRVNESLANGTVVSFRCREVGLQRLVGPERVTCRGCRTWSRGDVPTCVNPEQGDTVIIFSDSLKTRVDGALEVQRGVSVRLTCIAVEEAAYPRWSVPSERGIEAVPERMERQNDYLYMSHLDITNFGRRHEGRYGCAVENASATSVQLRVADAEVRCPLPTFDEEVLLADVEGTRVGATMRLSCRRGGNGTDNVATCLPTGKWSEEPPECKDVSEESKESNGDTDEVDVELNGGDRSSGCPRLNRGDANLIVQPDREAYALGDMVTFRCAPGYDLEFPTSRTICMGGRWTVDTLPRCREARER